MFKKIYTKNKCFYCFILFNRREAYLNGKCPFGHLIKDKQLLCNIHYHECKACHEVKITCRRNDVTEFHIDVLSVYGLCDDCKLLMSPRRRRGKNGLVLSRKKLLEVRKSGKAWEFEYD